MKALLPILLFVTGCISLDVSPTEAEPHPDGAVNVTMQFCDQTPSWFAYKNEGFDWVLRQVFAGQREFTFPAGERVTVVTGFGFSSLNFGFSEVVVRNITADEANAFRCRLTPVGVSRMTGLVATEQQELTAIQLGDAIDFTEGNQPFVMTSLGAGSLDLVAVNRLFSVSAPPRVIVRNNITVSNNAAIPMLDFAGPEARPLNTVKVRHNGGTVGAGFVQFETSRKSRVPLSALTSFVQDDTLRLAVIPDFFVKPGDLHRFDIQSGDRGVTYWQPFPRDTSVVFGAPLSAVTIDTILSAPILQPRARFASQAEYAQFAEVTFSQSWSAAARSVQIITSAAYLGGTPTQWDIPMPDLRGVIPDAWVLKSGQVTSARVTVRDARPALYHGIATPAAGETMRYASRLVQ